MIEDSRDSHLAGLVGNDDSDSSGRGARNQTFSLRLHLGDGVHGVLYGSLNGLYMDESEKRIELVFAGMWRTGESGGEWEEGMWRAVIEGARLKVVFDQICEGRRLSVKPTGKVDGSKLEVTGICVRRVDE